jgi:hypothetical protein
MRFYFEQNDKRFCSNDDKLVLLRHSKMTLRYYYIIGCSFCQSKFL